MGFLMIPWIAAFALALAVIGAAWRRPFRSGVRSRHLVLLLPLLSALALAFWGANFNRSRLDIPTVPAWQNNFTEILLWSTIPLVGCAIYLARGFRVFAALLSLCECVFVFGCYFAAFMRVSGDWI
jgi:hypothetical protein